MQDACERLRVLIVNAKAELSKEGAIYGNLLANLDALLQASEAGNDPSSELLKSTLRSIPRTRGGAPAGPGGPDAQKLWEELNRIVDTRQKPQDKGPTTRPSKLR